MLGNIMTSEFGPVSASQLRFTGHAALDVYPGTMPDMYLCLPLTSPSILMVLLDSSVTFLLGVAHLDEGMTGLIYFKGPPRL